MKPIYAPCEPLPAMLSRETVLDIIGKVSGKRLPGATGWEHPQMAACVQLIDSGHLDGCVVLDSNGRPQKIYGLCVTGQGQEILDESEAPPVSRFLLLRLHRLIWRISFACILLGLLIALPKQNTSLEKLTAENVNSFDAQPTGEAIKLESSSHLEKMPGYQTAMDLHNSSRLIQRLCAKNSHRE